MCAPVGLDGTLYDPTYTALVLPLSLTRSRVANMRMYDDHCKQPARSVWKAKALSFLISFLQSIHYNPTQNLTLPGEASACLR